MASLVTMPPAVTMPITGVSFGRAPWNRKATMFQVSDAAASRAPMIPRTNAATVIVRGRRLVPWPQTLSAGRPGPVLRHAG